MMVVYVLRIAIATIFGLVFGSFLNVCIYRLPRDRSLGGRSVCPDCEQPIPWYDNVPVLSYVFLGGKCRFCGESISIQYLLVELVSGFIFALSAWWWLHPLHTDWMNFLVVAVFVLTSLGITAVDLEFSIIPNEMNYFLLLLGLLLAGVPHYPFTAQSALVFDTGQFLYALSGLVVGGGLFFILAVISPYFYGRAALGMGDVKLIAAYGLWLGPQLVLFTIVFGALVGALVGTVLMIYQGKSLRTEIPFGPYLCVAGVVALVWGHEIVRWYVNLTRIGV